jgi:hypothetical protein
VNRPLTEKELESLRQCVERGQPYGGEAWVNRAAGKLGLANTVRPRGRPNKAEKKGPDTFSVDPGDDQCRFVVIEDNGDRLMLRLICDLPIPPVSVIRTAEVCKAND